MNSACPKPLPRGLTCALLQGHKGACKNRTRCPVCNAPVKFIEGDEFTYLACPKGCCWLDIAEVKQSRKAVTERVTKAGSSQTEGRLPGMSIDSGQTL